MQQGVGVLIIKPPGIRQLADTDTVHDDQDDAVDHSIVRRFNPVLMQAIQPTAGLSPLKHAKYLIFVS
jgi:Cu/Ag efflux pump CusA